MSPPVKDCVPQAGLWISFFFTWYSTCITGQPVPSPAPSHLLSKVGKAVYPYLATSGCFTFTSDSERAACRMPWSCQTLGPFLPCPAAVPADSQAVLIAQTAAKAQTQAHTYAGSRGELALERVWLGSNWEAILFCVCM